MKSFHVIFLFLLLLIHAIHFSSQQSSSILVGYIHPETGIDSFSCSSLENPCKTINYFIYTISNDADDIRIILLADWTDSGHCISSKNNNITSIHVMGFNNSSSLVQFDCNLLINHKKLKFSNLQVYISAIHCETIEILNSTITGISISRGVNNFLLENVKLFDGDFLAVASAQSLKIINSQFSGTDLNFNEFSNIAGNYEILNSTFSNSQIKISTRDNQRNVLISGCNFTESHAWYEGKIQLTIENCQFKKNFKAMSALLVNAIDVFKLSISNSTFEKCNSGAIYLEGVGISGEIKNSKFSENSNSNGGGAIYMKSIYSLSISESIFENNRHTGNVSKADQEGGGAIFQYQSLLSTSYCTFIGNEASSGGAILSLYALRYKSSNDKFLNNTALYGGAYSMVDLSYLTQVTFYDTLIQYNRAMKYGGGIFALRSYLQIIQSSLISFNRADISGGGIYSLETRGFMKYDNFKNNYAFTKNNGYIISNVEQFPELVGAIIPEKNFHSYNNQTYLDTTDITFGETVYINIVLLDGNRQQNSVTEFEISVESQSPSMIFDVLETNSFGVAGILYYRTDRVQFRNYTLTFTIKSKLFSQGDISSKISISVIPSLCPGWKSLQRESKKHNGEDIYACHFNALLLAPFIIVAVLIVCCLSSIIICISGYKIYGMRSKIQILRKKEQAEEELTQKLLELQTLYTSELESKYSLKNWLIRIEDIKVIKKIGEGGMGIVYLALWKNVQVALKSIKLRDDDIESNEFEHESSMLSSIRHPNIVNFYGVCLSDNSKFMVTEYMSGGSMESLIYECKLKRKHISLNEKISILIGIANGMSYLHGGKDSCIIHRDLKPGNILLSNELVPKVCDFGLSRLSNDNSYSTKTCQIGTLLYMSPEILLGKHYNETVDVYSFAIIMWQLIFDEANLFHHDYSTDPKYVTIMSKELQETFASFKHQSSLLLIPKLVSEGLRLPIPTLPMNGNSQIIRLWVKEFFISEDFKYNRNNSEETFSHYLHSLNSLFSLVNSCWSDTIQRPSFSDISQELSNIQTTL